QRRSFHGPPGHEFAVQLDQTECVEDVHSQDEPPKRHRCVMSVIMPPLFYPCPELAYGPRLVQHLKDLSTDSQQRPLRNYTLRRSDHHASDPAAVPRHPWGALRAHHRSRQSKPARPALRSLLAGVSAPCRPHTLST